MAKFFTGTVRYKRVFCPNFSGSSLPKPVVLHSFAKEVRARGLSARGVYSFLHSNNSFLLESSAQGSNLGRYSVIGFDPFIVFRSQGQNFWVNGKKKRGDAFRALGKLAKKFRVRKPRNMPFFSAGLYGYFSYDLNRQFEKINGKQRDDLHVPDMHFMFMDKLVVFDHVKDKIFCIGFARTKNDAEKKARSVADKILSAKARDMPVEEDARLTRFVSVKSNLPKKSFLRAVRKVKDYIFAGDVFQVNISQRLKAPLPCAPLQLYERLMRRNPAPFSAFMDFGGTQVLSSSPELLAKVEGGVVSTRPIAGTRKRGGSVREDARLARELLSNEKELAEHSMLVDLERNDLGRVCVPGSVKTPELFTVEKYARVQHIVSHVTGNLRRGLGCFDVVKAVFPGGTITGCPKVRAMEIINELEPDSRGIYTGSIGYIGFNNEMELNIAIRTMVVKGGKVFFSVGAGIVADSVPEKEFEETMHKARAMLEAIRGAKR